MKKRDKVTTDRATLDAYLTKVQEETLAGLKADLPHTAKVIGGSNSDASRMSARKMRRFFAKTQRLFGKKDGWGKVRG